MRHMIYGSSRTQNSMVTFIFTFDPRNGQLQVKLGQIRSNFKIQNFLTKICPSCADLSQDSKNVIYFMCDDYKCQKMHFKNVISSPFPVFGHCTAKNKDIDLKSWLHVVCMYLDHIYSGFLDNLKMLDFIDNYF